VVPHSFFAYVGTCVQKRRARFARCCSQRIQARHRGNSSRRPNLHKEEKAHQAREKEAREQAAREAKAAAPPIAFAVIELTGMELPITTLGALHTVGELKHEVAAATGTNAEQLQLVLRNQVLDDEEKTLSDCGVTAGSHVNAMSKNADIEEAVPPARP